MANLQWLIDRVPGFWETSPGSNNYSALKMIANTHDDNDKALDEVYRLWHIDTSYGQGLDDIGENLGFPRKNMNDEQYRRLLKVKRYLDMSNATNEDLNLIFDAFLGNDFIYMQEGWNSDFQEPAAIVLNISKNAQNIPYEIAYIAKSGGVRIYYSATYDSLIVHVTAIEYEYKTFQPITNLWATGWKKGIGDKITITLKVVDYEYKAFIPITNFAETESLKGIGDSTITTVQSFDYSYVKLFERTGLSYTGSMI